MWEKCSGEGGVVTLHSTDTKVPITYQKQRGMTTEESRTADPQRMYTTYTAQSSMYPDTQSGQETTLAPAL